MNVALTKPPIARLKRIIADAQEVLSATDPEYWPRRRRSSVDAEKMRADIIAKRAKGVSPKQLAEKCGVSRAYIYMIKK